jgi:hypothetical protein
MIVLEYDFFFCLSTSCVSGLSYFFLPLRCSLTFNLETHDVTSSFVCQDFQGVKKNKTTQRHRTLTNKRKKHTTIRKQTQIRHEPSYKQLEEKTQFCLSRFPLVYIQVYIYMIIINVEGNGSYWTQLPNGANNFQSTNRVHHDLGQVSGFLRVLRSPPPIKLTTMI